MISTVLLLLILYQLSHSMCYSRETCAWLEMEGTYVSREHSIWDTRRGALLKNVRGAHCWRTSVGHTAEEPPWGTLLKNRCEALMKKCCTSEDPPWCTCTLLKNRRGAHCWRTAAPLKIRRGAHAHCSRTAVRHCWRTALGHCCSPCACWQSLYNNYIYTT